MLVVYATPQNNFLFCVNTAVRITEKKKETEATHSWCTGMPFKKRYTINPLLISQPVTKK